MIIGLRGGHAAKCCGAVGIVKEYETMQEFYKVVAAILRAKGHTVIDCNTKGLTQMEDLSEGAARANNANVDIFVSLHMNASNGQGHGTEALISSTSSRSRPYAQRLCNNFAALGFTNRGVKVASGFYEMRHINAPNIIFEICFCDNAADMALFNKIGIDQLAIMFCKSIDPSLGGVVSAPVVQAPAAINTSVMKLQRILNAMGNKLTEDGIIGALTLSALNKIIIRRGDKSDLVKWIQSRIGVAADGNYGSAPHHVTFDAICNFQKKNGLAADGIVGPNTWAKLVK